MKKTFIFIGLIFILGFFNSCTKEYYYNTLETVSVNIYGSDWKSYISEKEDYDYCELAIYEITLRDFQEGTIQVYLQVGRDNNPDALYPLPDVKTYRDGNATYTETFSYELFAPNIIRFKRETSDLKYPDRTGTRRFRVTITHPVKR